MNSKVKTAFKWLWKLGAPIVSTIILIVFIVYGNKWFSGKYMWLIPMGVGILFGVSALGGIVNWFKNKFGTIKHEVHIVDNNKNGKKKEDNEKEKQAIAEVVSEKSDK